MPRPLDITCEVSEDGKIPKKYSQWIRDHLQLYAGREVRIRVNRPKRTTRANAFYWAARIEPIRQAMIEAGSGFMQAPDGSVRPVSSEAIHHHFKVKYLPMRTETVFGEDVLLPPTTTTLDQTEFSDYIRDIENDEEVRMLGIYFEDAPENLRSYKIEELPI